MNNARLNLLIVFGLTVAVCGLDPATSVAQRPSVSTIFQRLDNLESDVADLETENAALQAANAALEAKLANVTLNPGTVNGIPGPNLLIDGANLQVRESLGSGGATWTANELDADDGRFGSVQMAGIEPTLTFLGGGGYSIDMQQIGQNFALSGNDIPAMWINAANRNIGIGTTSTPEFSTNKLEVSSGSGDAIFGHSNNVGGYLGYETNISFGNPIQNLSGAGVYASNPAAGYVPIFAQTSGAANIAASIFYSNVWLANYNYVENPVNATLNPPASYSQLNNSNSTLTGFQSALRGFSNRGTSPGNAGYSVGVQGTGNSQNQDAFGSIGESFSNGGTSFGGYFAGNNYTGTNYAYAYVGGTSNGATGRKILGTGTVSEIVPTANHGRVTLTCPESPEYWYQDYGTVELVDGQAHVDLDPVTAEIIIVDADNPIRVFATPVNMLNFNGVAVVNQTPTGFDLVELNGGNHSGQLHYQLVMKPKTNFGEGRYPQAPGPAYLKADREPIVAKAANQPQPGTVFQWPSDHEQYGYDPAEMVGIGDRVPSGPHAGKFKVAEGEYMDYVPAERPDTIGMIRQN